MASKKVWCVCVDGRNTRGKVDQWIESITSSREGAKARAHRINTFPLLYPNMVAWVEYDEDAEETYKPNGKRKLTDAEVNEIFALRATGMTMQVIADQFGVSPSTISLICSGKRRDQQADRKHKLTPDQEDEIKELRAQGEAVLAIASKYGVSDTTVYRICSDEAA